MKKFHYRKRWLAHSVKIATEMMESGAISVITLTGARQVGKTTFVKHEGPFSSWRDLILLPLFISHNFLNFNF